LRRSHWWLLVGLRITKSQPISGHQRAWFPSSRLLWASGAEIDVATFWVSTATSQQSRRFLRTDRSILVEMLLLRLELLVSQVSNKRFPRGLERREK
jgi:hypothetical protein